MNAEQLKQKGNHEFSLKNWQDAASLYQQAIDLDPRVPMYYANLAATLIKLEKWAEGIQVSKQGLDVCKHNPDLKSAVKLYWRLGICFKEVGDFMNAKLNVELGLKKDPNNPTLLKELESIKILMNKEPEVVRSIPIAIHNVLPTKYYETSTKSQNASLPKGEAAAVQKTHSFIPPTSIDVYSLAQVLRCTPDERPDAYKYVFSIPGATLRKVCSNGIDYDLLDFVVTAALYVHNNECGVSPEDWRAKATEFLTELPACPRFSLSKMLMSADYKRLVSLAQVPEQVQRQWL